MHLLRRVLPDEEHRVAEELVWLRLVLDSHRPLPREGDTVATLQAEHLVADRGYLPEDHRPPEPSHEPDPLADRWRAHHELVDRVVHQALDALASTTPRRRRGPARWSTGSCSPRASGGRRLARR